MVKLFLSLLLTSQSYSAPAAIPGCVEPSNYSMEGKTVTLCWLENIEAWVSSTCISKKTDPCGSLKIRGFALQKLIALDESDTVGGKNPGCAICKKLGGKVKYGTEEGESQQTFCESNDGSFIDTNALFNAFTANPKGKAGGP